MDILSGGRLRLGVGIGWNAVEYGALNEDFHTRGRRQEEQVALLRELWANETVDWDRTWHRIEKAGINPRPSRQIPIWFGGRAEATLRRAARMGDGWMPMGAAEAVRGDIHRLRTYLGEYERDSDSFGIDPQVPEPGGNPERWRHDLHAWGEIGATHISVRTMGGGYSGAGEHIAAIRRYMEAVKEEWTWRRGLGRSPVRLQMPLRVRLVFPSPSRRGVQPLGHAFLALVFGEVLWAAGNPIEPERPHRRCRDLITKV